MKTKELKEFPFHSKHLIPFSVAEKGPDAIQSWIDNEQATNRFSEGDEVVHRDNLALKMYVKEIMKQIVEKRDGTGKDGKPIMRKISKMVGVVCYYWSYAEIAD
jgi:hypothetical protein